MMSRLIHTYTICLAILSLLIIPAAFAQQEEASQPGPIFLSAFKTVTEAEKLQQQKSYKQAWEKYHQALRYYKTLSYSHPDWKPHLVNGRIESTEAVIKEITPLAEKEFALERERMANFIEGNPNNHDRSIPDPSGKIYTPSEQRDLTNINNNIGNQKNLLEREKLKHAQEVRQLNDQIKALRGQLLQATNGADSTQVRILNGQIAQLQQEIRKLQNSDNATRQKYLNTLEELQRQRARLAAAPLRKDVDKLRDETERQRRELEAISRAYKTKESELQKSRKELAASQTNYQLLSDKLKRSQKQLDDAQNNANLVVEALRKENADLLKQVTEQQELIAQQQSQIKDLTGKLAKSEGLVQELRLDLEKMTQERDQLTELLKLSDVERGKELMKENLRIGRELANAKRDLEILNKDKNAAQDRIIEAENKLDVAKNEILRQKQNNISYMKRITQLETTLKDTREQLSAKLNQPQLDDTAREEAEILRGTVQRLMAAQTRRRKVEEAFFKEYAKMAKKDKGVEDLFQSLADNTVTLTEQERKYLAMADSTDTLVSPLRKYASETERDIAEQKRDAQMDTYHKVAKRLIEQGQLEPAISTYDLAYDITYDFNCLVNGGALRLRLGKENGDTELFQEAERIFQTAVTTRPKSAYSHFMLGMIRYNLTKPELASKSLQQAIDLKPDYPVAHLFLGIIAAQSSEFKKAEESFTTAIGLNPQLHDAHYNLSVLHLMKGDLKEARRYYNDALRSGHPIDREHERKIGINKAG